MVLHLRQGAPSNWLGAKCADAVTVTILGDGTREVSDPFFEGPEKEAVAFCREPSNGVGPCPLVGGCKIFALVNNEKSGVWGGHGETDRRAIRKQWPLRRGRVPRPEWSASFEPGEPTSWFAPEELVPEENDD